MCALELDGTLSCWGLDNPAPQGAGPFVELGLASQTACARSSDGTVTCWGSGEAGGPAPQPPAGVKFSRVTSGRFNSCGIEVGGSLRCWPSTGPLPNGTFSEVAAGFEFGCGIRDDGSLICWGAHPPKLTAAQGPYHQLAALEDKACALDAQNLPHCWWNGDDPLPTPLAKPFTELALSVFVTCGLTPAGAVECWGSDSNFAATRNRPGAYTHIASNSGNSMCGLRPNGRLECWGELERPRQ